MNIVIMLMILSFSTIHASLFYLDRTTPAETAFETVDNNFTQDYQRSSATLDDALDEHVSIGFSFPFRGSNYDEIIISSNGVAYFTDSGAFDNDTERRVAAHYTDRSLSTNKSDDSTNYAMSNGLYPYWDDLNPHSQGYIRYGLLGTENDQHFVIWWDGIPQYNNTSSSYSFQLILYTDGSIRYRYLSSSDANGDSEDGATIGVKEDEDHYDQYTRHSHIDQSKDVLYSPVAPPTDNDYSDFHFDELYLDGTENELKDSHWGKDGEGHDVKAVKGKICNGIDLTKDSDTDYAKLDPVILDGTTNFTVAVWHKGESSSSSVALLSGANDSEDNEILFWMDNATKFYGVPKDKWKSVSSSNINDGTWHHLAWRMENKKGCFFFDGSKQGCQDFSYAPSTFSLTGFILGQDQDEPNGRFDSDQDWEGVVDELLIFRKALTDSEIQTGYDNQNSGKNWDGTDRVCPYPSVAKSSCVISDPVNGTHNPKRIPGASIRYSLEIDNPNTSKTDDNILTDSLDETKFDKSSIKNLKISDDPCDCLNPGTTSSNGSSGSSDGENSIKLDLGTIDGQSKKCGYFETNIL